MQSVIDFPWEVKNVTGTLLVKTGTGALHTIVVNSIAAQSSVAIYDGLTAAGTLLGTLTAATSHPVTLMYGARISTGIYIVITGTADLTVTYK
jgi:predicted secreted Zn-dependent protease